MRRFLCCFMLFVLPGIFASKRGIVFSFKLVLPKTSHWELFGVTLY